jgi:peroxiredoxin
MKKTIALVLLLCCLVTPPTARAQAMAEPTGEVNFKLQGIDGKTYDMAEMRGQVLLISFGATWCQPCAAELRALEELQREFKHQPVRFFWVSLERDEEISTDKLRSFTRSKEVSFPVLRDPTGFTYAQFSTRRRIPLVIFINREGKLVLPHHLGMAEPELYKRTIRERLNRLLQTQAPAATTATQ